MHLHLSPCEVLVGRSGMRFIYLFAHIFYFINYSTLTLQPRKETCLFTKSRKMEMLLLLRAHTEIYIMILQKPHTFIQFIHACVRKPKILFSSNIYHTYNRLCLWRSIIMFVCVHMLLQNTEWLIREVYIHLFKGFGSGDTYFRHSFCKVFIM